ncbi:YfcC family protein [Jeotgalicoccus halotolerans]|uniref:Putative ion transporter superfamily protein YfcC n=1 Tax=Jeotgalicoccus halotolerans TaxID=157227 RepID=A0A3E0AWY1_9STAP|nr:AbgT family transporter [Jeotgalicoccus halotolerans]REG24239.1 putative ion transporter superfamily protein YfcC [Jeotgalicoccus halotolerans]
MTNEKNKPKKKRKFQFPDAYGIMFIFLIIAAIATYLIPAGQFETEPSESGPDTIVPGTYETIDSNPAGIMDIFSSIVTGLTSTSDLIFLVLIIGGVFGVIEKTGAMDAMMSKVISITKNKEWLLIVLIMLIFSIFGTLGIVVNAVIAFIPLGIILAKSMKMDAIIGVSIIYLGAYTGFAMSILDPLTVGFAQQIAGVPLFSGAPERTLMFIITLIVTMIYVIWYSKRIKRDQHAGILGSQPFPKDSGDTELGKTEMTTTHILVLLTLLLGITVYVAGVFGAFGEAWSLTEMAAVFIIIMVVTTIIARIGVNQSIQEFIKGANSVLYGALIIGMARSIVVVLEDGMILDTVVNGMASLIDPFSSTTGAVLMFIGNGLFNILVSSGSGQAAIVMPIMGPIADLMEFPRQIAVQAYSMGDGFTNIITPLSGVLMANLAIAGIPFTKWLKFALPLVGIWYVLGIIYLIVLVAINWGAV